MKKDIHPDYGACQTTCSCGNAFTGGGTQKEVAVEICSKCHPFFTGEQKLMSTGQLEKFKRRYGEKTGAAKKDERETQDGETQAAAQEEEKVEEKES